MRTRRAGSSSSSRATDRASWHVTASRLLAASALAAACGHATPAASPTPTGPAPAAAAAPAVTPAQVTIEPAANELAWLGLWFATGTTRVIEVVDASPAARAGIRIGDEVLSIDGVAMRASQQIVKLVAEAAPGSQIALALSRDGKPLELVVKLAARPSDDRLLRDKLVGKPAPAFTATTLDGGKPLTLASLRGNVVLIDFWATWCGPCALQFPHLNRMHQQYAKRGLRILALSDGEADLVRDYVRTERLAYPVALDPGTRIRSAYLVRSMPTTVIIDRSGVVRFVAVGVCDPVELESVVKRLL